MKQIIFFDPASNIQHSETVTDQQYVLIRSLIDMIRPIGVKPEFKVLRDKVEEVVKIHKVDDPMDIPAWIDEHQKKITIKQRAFANTEEDLEGYNYHAHSKEQKPEILPEIKSQIDPKK